MKLKITKEWLQKWAALDEKTEEAAGCLDIEELIKEADALRKTPNLPKQFSMAFGKFIRSIRLDRGLSCQKLANEAEIDEKELEKIENNNTYMPEPRTVYQLSRVLKLPQEKMLRLAGHLTVTDSEFSTQVERFAARAKNFDKLNKEEYEALKEFVKYLAKR